MTAIECYAHDVPDRARASHARDDAVGPIGPPASPPIRRSVVTMRDIAAAAEVSQSTVSRVLNDAPTRVPIAAETRKRVIDAARHLGYQIGRASCRERV